MNSLRWRLPRRASKRRPTPAEPHPLQLFHQHLGHLAIGRHNTLWQGAGRFSMVTFPSNQRIAASKREIQQLLVDCGRLAAVFCPLTGSGVRVKDYWLESKDYGLDRLQRQFRRHVREHAGQFVARELDWQEMATGALAIHADVAARRGPMGPHWSDRERWAEVCRVAAGTDGLTAYGCLIDNRIAGYVVSWREHGVCHGVLINRTSQFDSLRTGNVLMYSFSRHQISRNDTAAINLGRSWYPANANLDSFKRHAGFDERETVLAVVLHPRLDAILRATSLDRCLQHLRGISGGRLGFAGDLQLLEAARLTALP